MIIRGIKDKKEWAIQHKIQDRAEFLQSWEWGECQKLMGNEILRLQVIDRDEVVNQMQGIVYELMPGVRFVYLPRIDGEYLDGVVEYLKREGYIFVRVEAAARLETRDWRLKIYVVAPRQPRYTLVLDVSQSEEALLEGMHAKTRYNIGLAGRKGVEIREEKNSEIFWQLNTETTGRDGFKSHNKEYYQKILALDMAYQFTAYIGHEAIASNICVGYGDTFTYVHGASGNTHRNLMAPYLLQWEQIRFAKANGFSAYDFWGIASPGGGGQETTFHGLSWQANDEWTGITRFKAGFGGERKTYPEAVEVVFRPWLYMFYKKIKDLKLKIKKMKHEARKMRQKKYT